MRGILAVAMSSVAACGGDPKVVARDAAVDSAPLDANSNLTEVALIPATISNDLDLLFVIDDSPSMLDKQTNLKASFPAFINELNALPGGLPNVHIGVVTSDLARRLGL